MEKFIQRENVMVEFASSSKGISERMSNKDMDFNDVFGGPPRRFSNQEAGVRYSFGESVESEGTQGDSWMKPVFGEENAARRRHQGDGFYDDIFKADESRDRDRDSLLWSGSSSRNMSPARSSSSKADVLGTSLPPQLFSLPTKSSKAADHPVFASQDYKTDDSTNIVNSPRSPSTSFSRFLAQAFKSKDDNRNEFHSITRPSPLSREPSLSSLDSSSKIASDKKGNIVEKLNKETKIADSDGGQFHFSIYTWAGIGVPMVMPLLSVNQSIFKDNGKYNKSANSYGKMGGDSLESKRSTVTNHGFSTNAVAESLKEETEKKDLRTKEEGKKVQISAEEKLHETAESKTRNKVKDRVDLVGARRTTQSVKVKSVDEIEKRDKTDKEVPMPIEEVLKSTERILRESDKVKQPGKVSEVKENKTWSSKEAQPDTHVSKNVKKKEGTRMDSDSGNVEKSTLRGGSKVSGVTPGKTGVKGRVKDFVQIFNQETDSNPKADVQTRNPSARWKAVNIDQTENEVSVNAEKVNLHNVEKKPDVPHKVDKNLHKDEPKQYSFTKDPSGRSEHSSSNPKNTFSSESLHRDRKISFDTDDPFANFVVEELFDDQEKVTQSGEGSEDMKALDAKIQQWSVGKKGNIRSLLSTLQFVLWPGSGWKPVALVDLIESNSVRRAYQKALLRIHPDKLQQKGAESTQKFIAERVFDILQEAWDHFNSVAPL